MLLGHDLALADDRQGEMALYHPISGRWADRHFVLTKAGFLHWFESVDELQPLDCLNLSRCQFESGQDAEINISESQGGKVCLAVRYPSFNW